MRIRSKQPLFPHPSSCNPTSVRRSPVPTASKPICTKDNPPASAANLFGDSQSPRSAGNNSGRHLNNVRIEVEWIDSWEDLLHWVPAWNRLAESAVWRNPSLEPNFLLPALRHLNPGNVRVLIATAQESLKEPPDPQPVSRPAPRELLAVVPVRMTRLYGLPLAAAEVWQHEQCFDATPLIHSGHAATTWKSILEFLNDHGVSLLKMDLVSAEKGFQDLLDQTLEQSAGRIARFQKNRFERAAFRPAKSIDEYLQNCLSKNARKSFRKQLKRLKAAGDFSVESMIPRNDAPQLAAEFLDLEASGWKGRDGTALASSSCTRQFYLDLIAESAKSGKARFLTLRLDGQPIAMLSDIQSNRTVYSYKTAYDESFAQFSPGVVAEFLNLQELHEDGIELADSCTAADNATINRVWGQKLKFQNLVLALRPGMPQWVVKSLPMAHGLVRWLRRKLNS